MKLPFGWVLNVFVGRRRRDVEADVKELREDRQRRGEELNESRRSAAEKPRRGVRLLAGVDVREMTEEDWLSMFEGSGDARELGSRGRGGER